MFYGVVQEQYLQEVDVKAGITKAVELIKKAARAIIDKFKDLLEAAKKRKDHLYDKMKKVYDTLKEWYEDIHADEITSQKQVDALRAECHKKQEEADYWREKFEERVADDNKSVKEQYLQEISLDSIKEAIKKAARVFIEKLKNFLDRCKNNKLAKILKALLDKVKGLFKKSESVEEQSEAQDLLDSMDECTEFLKEYNKTIESMLEKTDRINAETDKQLEELNKNVQKLASAIS